MSPAAGAGVIRAVDDTDEPGSGGPGDTTPDLTPLLEGHLVQLRPVENRDYDLLYRIHTEGDHLVRYRLRGATPSPDAFARFVWDQVLVHFVVHARDGRPVGVVSAYEPDFRNRYVYIAACSLAEFETTGLVLEGVALLVSYLFENFDLRKVYAESLAVNFDRFAFGDGRFFDVEGRMRAHEYVAGTYQDLVLLAIHRDDWREHHRRIFGKEGRF
jgi:RimJ/RimL family protein N-acetyltransferase